MAETNETTRDRLLLSAEKLVMANGFAGTTIDHILKDAGLTKGAFFHYFKGKADLALALVEWHTARDLGHFDAWMAEAEALSGDPLIQMNYFLEQFEKYVADSDDPSPGCMYATYTYESMQFEPAVRDFVADTLRRWTSIYVRKFQDILDSYKPAIPISARQLAEMIVSIIEGGLVLQRAYGDLKMTARQSEQFRNYLKLLFGEPKAREKEKAREEAYA
jgi:TetR/AcrR family transcriptional repressor of nem operon